MSQAAAITDRDSRCAEAAAPGEPIAYWQLGATAEQRFDVPDQPMKGEMDPFFFLTKHKNFIPHEYPCRTSLRRTLSRQAAGRPRRLRARAQVAALRLAAVDLSGFWFRPTRLAHLGATRCIEAGHGGHRDAAARHLRRRRALRERQRSRLDGAL